MQAETVTVLLENVRGLLEDEDARSASVNARATQLVSFTAVLLALAAGLGARDIVDPELSAEQKWVAVVFFMLGLAGLTWTIGTTIFGTLMPSSYETIAQEELDLYETELPYEDPTNVRGRTMRGLIQALRTQRRRNDTRVRHLRWSYWGLVGAIVAFAGVGATIGLDRIGVL